MKTTFTSIKKRFLGLFLLLPLIIAGFSSQAYSQYSGVGEFTLITSQGELEDGYYVVTNAAGAFAMNNAHTGSLLPETPVSPEGAVINSPDVTDVWYIESNGDGYTIFSENSGQYVSYTATNNSIQVTTEVEGDAQRWSFDYFTEEGEFEVRNLATVERAIRYNPSSPRFVTYSTGFGDNLNLYKLGENGEPVEGIGLFSLLSPPNNFRLPVFEGNATDVVIEWEAANNANAYTWVANLPGGGFEEPLLELPADNSGAANTLTLTSGAIYDVLAGLEIAEGTSTALEWTVIASNDTDDPRQANQVWTINLVAPVVVADIQALRAAEPGATVYAVTTESTFIGGDNFRNTKFFQDASGFGIQIDDSPGRVQSYEVGDNVDLLVGTRGAFQGQVQFVAYSDFGPAVSAGNEIVPVVRTLNELTQDDQSRLVLVNAVEFESAGENFGGGGSITNITDPSIEGFEGTYRNVFGGSDITGSVIPEVPVNITGIIQENNAGLNLAARNLADIVDPAEEDIVATPVFDPAPGSFVEDVTVAITTETPDAVIYYTVNGEEPTVNDELYTEPITFTETTTLSARAFLDGFVPSAIASGEYVVTEELVITTIAQLQEQVGAGEVTFSGEAVITYQQSFRNQKFIQDETGGILIDDNGGNITTEYEVGDVLTNITGTVSEFGNMIQFVPAVDPGAPVDTGVEVEPIVLSLEELYADFAMYRSRVVTVQGARFSEAGTFANGTVYPIQDMDNAAITGEFRTTFFGVDYIGTPLPDGDLNISGIPNSRTDGDYLTARNQADIVPFATDDQVVAPSVNPASGLYTEDVTVTMSVEDDQASIYYTLDGEDPTESSTLYTGEFIVSETTTVSARAFRSGFQPSGIVSRTYSFPVAVQTLAEARALEVGTAVQVFGLSTTPDFGFDNAEFYIQDATGGFKVRWVGFGGGNNPETPFAEGQDISLIGMIGTRFDELQIEPVDFEVFSENNPLPDAVVIDDYETLWTAESPQQGRRVTIQNVSLVDPSAWPTAPIEAGSGLTVQAVDAAGNIYDIRIDRGESEFDGSPVPPEVFNLSGILGRFNDNAQLYPFFLFELEEAVGAPRAQIIHNAADPALAEVDIYVNGEVLFSEVPFRGATPFFDAPADVEFNVSLTAAGDDLENAVFEADVTLESGSSYYIVARGLLDPSAFNPNPDGVETAFGLDIIEGAIEAAADEDNFDFFIYHGVTDAPTVDVNAVDVAQLASGLSYTDATEMAISVPADSYLLTVNPAGSSVAVAGFTADVTALAGEGAIILASGFLDASQGEAFGLLVVLPNGATLLLDAETSIEGGDEVPREFALQQNYPNPFNPTTQIQYALPEAVSVRVEVYNITGQLVATLVNGQQAAGVHTVTFDANRLSSGVYLYRIQAGSFSETRKMMLVK